MEIRKKVVETSLTIYFMTMGPSGPSDSFEAIHPMFAILKIVFLALKAPLFSRACHCRRLLSPQVYI